MYIHEMSCFNDSLIVNNKNGIKAILTPIGAVYDNFKTSDTRNLARAFAALFDSQWRFATGLETREFHLSEAEAFHHREKFTLSLINTPVRFAAKQISRPTSHLTLVVNNG